MREKKPKSEALYARVTPETKQRFAEVAARFGLTPSDVLRELVVGFIEGRVTVMPPEDVKESIYHVPRSED